MVGRLVTDTTRKCITIILILTPGIFTILPVKMMKYFVKVMTYLKRNAQRRPSVIQAVGQKVISEGNLNIRERFKQWNWFPGRDIAYLTPITVAAVSKYVPVELHMCMFFYESIMSHEPQASKITTNINNHSIPK